MQDNQPKSASKGSTRRDVMRKGAKAAYMAPLVLAAVKATERPAYAQASGHPVSLPPVSPPPI